MRRTITSLAALLVFTSISAQVTFQSEWDIYNNASGISDDYIHSVYETSDGGYVVSGEANSGCCSPGSSMTDMYIMKVNSAGSVIWRNLTDDSELLSETGNIALPAADGGYAVVGSGNAHWNGGCGGFNDLWSYAVWKYSSAGSLQWSKTYGGTCGMGNCADFAGGGQPTPDGGYIIGGGGNGCFPHPLLIKMNSDGNIQWQKSYGLAAFSALSMGGLALTDDDGDGQKDDGYAVFGHFNPCFGCSADMYLLKINTAGTVMWCNSYASASSYLNVYAKDALQQTSDGGYIVTGTSDQEAFVMKLASTGGISWSNGYGGAGTDRALQPRQTSDGGYIVAGAYNLTAMLMKLTSGGNVSWTKNMSAWYQLRSVQQTADGGYITGGEKSNGGANPNSVLMKTDVSGNVASANCSAVADVILSPAAVAVSVSSKTYTATNQPAGTKTPFSVFASSSVIMCSPLPVEWLSFTGRWEGDKNILEWQTASGYNIDFFTIKKKAGNEVWETIGRVEAGTNGGGPGNYSFTDKNISAGLAYYRLNQTDNNGESMDLGFVAVQWEANNPIVIQPDLLSGVVLVTIHAAHPGQATTLITDALGKTAGASLQDLKRGENELREDISGLQDGTYFIRVSMASGESMTQRVFIY